MPLRQGRAWRDDGYHLDAIISNHALFHTGMTYSVGMTSKDVAAAGSIEITFLTGDTYEAHVNMNAYAEGHATLEIIESRSVTGGTAMTPRNRNRSLTRAANGATVDLTTLDALCAETVKHTPATSSGGTTIFSAFIPGGGNQTGGAFFNGERDEWILAPSTQYTFKITNDEANAKDMTLSLLWYEHPRNSQQAPEVL